MLERDPDNWRGVEDARERKRIQDRLAQRARRRRIAQERLGNNKMIRVSPRPSPSTAYIESPQEYPYPSPISILSSATFAVVPLVTQPSAGPIFTEVPPLLYAALFDNGAMMGLTCSTTVPAKSQPMGPEIPAPLRPTPLQLTTCHPSWIDRFPFARLRDNLILLSGTYDEEEFVRDLFSMRSFRVRADKPSWDPEGWAIYPEFLRKWKFVLS